MTSNRSTASAVTAREHEVLALIEGHLTNSQIAERLCLSIRTVESHVSSLMRKLDVEDRRSLARHADRASRPSDRDRWPAAASSFVGREREQRALRRALAGHRMVTVTGPGGVGKTRLTLEVAEQASRTRRDGGWFVDLVNVSDPDLVSAALADTVGVAELPGGSLADSLAAALRTSDALIVLDNCEHVLPAARRVAELLITRCPRLQVIATSRARLGASFEWVYELPGLSTDSGGPGRGDAVTLFVERAAAAGGTTGLDHDQVGELCRALDGMALAIELAAARYPSLGIDGLMAGLDHRLRYFTTGDTGDDRHRSLADAIDWSYDLLSPADQALLEVVSVFASWFDVRAAASLAALPGADVADALARLADHHLLVAVPGQPTRYRVLETIRQYADERLTRAGRSPSAHDRHRTWCADMLDTLAAPPYDTAWCTRFDGFADEARAAILWADQHLDPGVVDLADALAELLVQRGHLTEAQRRYEQAAERSAAGADRIHRWRLAAGVAAARVTGNDTLRLLDAAATEALALGARDVAADCRAWMVIYVNMMPGIMAAVPSAAQGARWLDEARTYASGAPGVSGAVDVATASGLPATDPEAVRLAVRAEESGRAGRAPLVESVALDQLCSVALARGHLTEAIAALRRRGAVLDPLPLDATTAYQFNDYLLMGSEVHLGAGDLSAAADFADRLAGLACYRELAHLATSRRIKVDAMAGDLAAAAHRGERFFEAWERAGRPIAGTLNVTCYALAMVHALLGDEARRREWADVTEVLTADPARLAGCQTGWAPTFDALVDLDRGQPEAAMARLSADVDDGEVWSAWIAGLWRPWYAALWVEAAVLAGHPAAEDRIRRGGAATRENPIAAAIVARAASLSRDDLDALTGYARTFGELGCPYQQDRTLRLLARR